MSKHIIKRHNKSLLIYHMVCPSKYRRKIFSELVESTLKETCKEISKRYEINFIEIGRDEDHVYFLVQSVPTTSPKSLVQTIKSITVREIFKIHPEVKQLMWDGHIWTSGYYINTLGAYKKYSNQYWQNTLVTSF